MCDSKNLAGDGARQKQALDGGPAELADLILAIGRLIRPPADLAPLMCTAVESSVMRFIDRNPGSSAKAAAEAALLPSSNFARVLRSLEDKGLVRREIDVRDARSVRLHATELAQENRRRLQEAWTQTLDGILDDPTTMTSVIVALRHVEEQLTSRARRR